MIAKTQVFWLEARASAEETGVGLLCRRHAEAMIVPRGWTLDDRRDPDLHLFKPPETKGSRRPRTRRKPVTTGADDTAEQLRLGESSPTETGSTDTWTPSFDTDDDLDGLLSAKSPLLSRAFRGDGRPSAS